MIAAGAWSISGLLDGTPSSHPTATKPAIKSLAEMTAYISSELKPTVPVSHQHQAKVSKVAATSRSWNIAKSEADTFTPSRKRVTSVPAAVLSSANEMENAFFTQGLSGMGRSARTKVVTQLKSNSVADQYAAMGGGFGYGFGDAPSHPSYVDTDGDGYGDRIDSDPLDSYLWQDWDRDGKNDPMYELPTLADSRSTGSIGSGSVRDTWLSSGSSSEKKTLPPGLLDFSDTPVSSETEANSGLDD
jgi:hypothetical protein